MEIVTNNLVDVYTELRASGYDQEIHLHKTHLHAIEKDVRIEAKDFKRSSLSI